MIKTISMSNSLLHVYILVMKLFLHQNIIIRVKLSYLHTVFNLRKEYSTYKASGDH